MSEHLSQQPEFKEDAPNDPVVIFIASRNTSTPYRRALWRVSREDAMKVCNDLRTSSENHMLCWTADGIDDPEVTRYVADNGRYGDVLAEHQVIIRDSKEMQDE